MCSMIRCTEGGTGSREAVTGYAYPACHGQGSPVWVASHRRPGRSVALRLRAEVTAGGRGLR
jgi:hypothetical protein